MPHATKDVRDVRHVDEHLQEAHHAGVNPSGSLLLPCDFLQPRFRCFFVERVCCARRLLCELSGLSYASEASNEPRCDASSRVCADGVDRPVI